MEILTQVLELLKPVLESLLGGFGPAVQILSIIATLRLFFKPILAAVESAVKESETKSDDQVLEKVEGNKIWKAAVFLLDLLASIKIKPKQ